MPEGLAEEAKAERDYKGRALISSYDKLDIIPHQIHKSKKEHNMAIFELSKGIANLLQENDYSISQQIHDSLERMCNRFRK